MYNIKPLKFCDYMQQESVCSFRFHPPPPYMCSGYNEKITLKRVSHATQGISVTSDPV